MHNTNQHEDQQCISCKEQIDWSNTQSPAGWREMHISGMCEKCYDNCTFDLDIGDYKYPEEILDIVKDGVVLAGGALRALVNYDDNPSDYDLFFTKDKVMETELYFGAKGYKVVFRCPKNELTTMTAADGTKVQLITKEIYSSPQELVDSFDITACCAAWDGEVFYKHDRFVFDNINKLINFNRVDYPVATVKRLQKYIQKGFSMQSKAALDLVLMINKTELTEENMKFYID